MHARSMDDFGIENFVKIEKSDSKLIQISYKKTIFFPFVRLIRAY